VGATGDAHGFQIATTKTIAIKPTTVATRCVALPTGSTLTFGGSGSITAVTRRLKGEC
jgi:hypothetical protein